ncbi:MAG: cellulase family glycosylhydrolase [Myxococcota bacterium]|nr:cellulase family glycosylhydrolase [Myxococcota bacterium]
MVRTHRPRRTLATLLGVLLAGQLVSATCRPLPEIPGPFIRDADGRALILHGLNFSSSSKWPPYQPWQEPADLERMSRDWGMNFARFLVSWIAIEPVPGVYDEAYLDTVEVWLDRFAAEGVFVVIDMHQDVYGPVASDGRAIGGNGHPAWSFLTDDEPFTRETPWFLNYFTPAVTRGFDNFWNYDEHPELQDHYAGVLARLAQRFADHPAVLGYDIMNEPWAGIDAFAGHERFDTGVYKDFLDRMIAAIRVEDDAGWIFFEPRAFGPNDGFPSYIPPLADPRAGAPRLAYFPHYYSVSVDVGGVYRPGVDESLPRWAVERRAEAERYDAPLLLGEFGTGLESVGYEAYLKDVLRMADGLTSGWAFWEYGLGGWSPVRADRTESPIADLLVRAYPRRVAGTPLHVDYDPDRRVLLFAFAGDPAIEAPSELFVPAARFFPDGFDVFTSDADGTWRAAWDASREILTLCSDRSQSLHVISIQPAGPGGPVSGPWEDGRLSRCD